MLRLGLIGLGYWGPNYARVVNELPDCELVAACDLSHDALALVGGRYPLVRTGHDPVDVLAANDVDAVVVATPTRTHYELSLAALDAGKHVLCEKPLAMTSAECGRLIDAADREDRVLSVGHTFIFNPAVRRMRELIQAGEIGRFLYCHAARTALGPIRRDVNALWDLAPHDLSIFLHLVGEDPVSVSATGHAFFREATEDVAFVYLRFPSGVVASAHVSWLDPYKVRRVTVVGERRMLVFDDISPDEKLRLFDRGASYEAVSEEARGTEFGEYKTIIRDGDILVPKLPASEPLKEQVRHFVACCENGVEPEADGGAGLRVVRVLEAASESLRLHGAPVELGSLVARGAS